MCTFACCAGVSFKSNTDSAKEIRHSSPGKSRVGSPASAGGALSGKQRHMQTDTERCMSMK